MLSVHWYCKIELISYNKQIATLIASGLTTAIHLPCATKLERNSSALRDSAEILISKIETV
jgi:hypothetical protein